MGCGLASTEVVFAMGWVPAVTVMGPAAGPAAQEVWVPAGDSAGIAGGGDAGAAGAASVTVVAPGAVAASVGSFPTLPSISPSTCWYFSRIGHHDLSTEFLSAR